MNSLSWIIYLSELIYPLSIIFIFLSVWFFIVTINWILLCADDVKPEVRVKYPINTLRKHIRKSSIAFLLTLFFFIIIPSKETVMKITLSEYAEKIITHEKVSNIVDPAAQLLSQWVKKELDRIKKD